MKKLLLMLCIAALGNSHAQDASRMTDSIVSHFNRGGYFHGAILVAQDGKPILRKAFGYADAATKTPNDVRTIYPIGSITKQFTAAAIMKLQEQGMLRVEDTIKKFFPELKHAEKITLHHLLTHTSGLFNYTNDTSMWYGELSEKKLVDYLNGKALDFEPGTSMRYNNSGYALAGYIIARVSGKTYEQFIREQFFKPLGMNQSGFDFENLRSAQKPTGYYDNGTLHSKARPVDSTVSFAAGAIYSTVDDLFKWAQAMHNKKILNPASWETMMRAYKNNYGYGLVIDSLEGEPNIWHNGGLDGFVSNLIYLPRQNIVVISLSNYMQSNLMDLNRVVGTALLGKPFELPAVRNEVELPAESLKDYPGIYQLIPGFSITITLEDQQLMAQATGQQKFQVYPEKKDFFFYKVVDAQLEFERDAGGRVVGLILHQNGMKQKAKKIQ